MNKTTLVLGASTNSDRYSNIAVRHLRKNGHTVVAIGNKSGLIGDVSIMTDTPLIENVHTVTLYLNPNNQINYYQYILSLKPKRIIFNPGTENDEFFNMASDNGIDVIEACTLVLLSTGQY